MKRVMTLLAVMALSWSVMANTEVVDGITWTFTVSDGETSVGCGYYGAPAVPTSTKGAITIPSKLGGYPVTSIGDWAFSYCSGLTSVTIPSMDFKGTPPDGIENAYDGGECVSAFSQVDPKIATLYARWVESDATLYARWQANAYSVQFDANGGTGDMSAQPFLHDQTQALAGNAFTKLGYTFKGWSTIPDGEVVYADTASISNLTAATGFAVALFAKWEKVIDVTEDEIDDWVYELAPQFKWSGETNSSYRKRFSNRFGNDLNAAFFAETGKIGADGTRLQVRHDYVAGTDPLDENSKFTASITTDADGNLIISYSPELTDAEKALRVYRTWGKVKLQDAEWVEVPEGNNADYNFFKVSVEMK